MSGYRKYHGHGMGQLAGSAVLAIVWALACGNGFNEADCKATRTCPGPAQAGESGARAGGEAGNGVGGESGSAGGEGGAQGGAQAKPECTAAVDCENGNAVDGVEACVNGACRPGDPPPRVVSITPGHESEGAEPNGPVVIEFSEALDPETLTAESVQLLDGETPVPGTLSYDAGVATFVPDTRLRLRAVYDVVVTDAVADLAGTTLWEPFRATFSVRDGAWHTVEVPQEHSSLAFPSPMTGSGAVLLAWSGGGVETCPGAAAWLELGETKVTPLPFGQGASSCAARTAAVGPEGSAIFAFNADEPSYTRQYRNGAWESQPAQATPSAQSWVSALAISPLGVATRFERAVRVGSVVALHTNAEGIWQTARDELVPATIHVLSELSVAYDRDGNGMAAFKAWDSTTDRTQIMVSRYTPSSDKWASAQVLPGSATDPSEVSEVLGGPGVAMAPTGEALVVWRAGQAPGWLRSSSFQPEEGWFNAEMAIPRQNVFDAKYESMSVIHDGSRFVTAWAGESEEYVMLAHTATYQAAKGWSAPEEHDAGRYVPHVEHPQLASDGHGRTLLVWRTIEGEDYDLVERRFVDGAWGKIELLADSEVPFDSETSRRKAVMNESGVASITLPMKGQNNADVGIRVLRFF